MIPLGITCIFYYFMLKRLWHLPKPGVNGNGVNDNFKEKSSVNSFKTNVS